MKIIKSYHKLILPLITVSFLGLSLYSANVSATNEAKDEKVCKEIKNQLPPTFKNVNEVVYLKNSVEKHIPAKSTLFDADGKPEKYCSQVGELLISRDPKKQVDLGNEMTNELARYNMGFLQKDEETHLYDKAFDVKVNSIPLVIKQGDFDSLVRSTGPVLRAYRTVDQIFYSGDKNKLTPKSFIEKMGLNTKDLACSENYIQNMINSLQKTIYDIPQLHNSSMADYPFMAVAGVDTLMDNPQNMNFTFAEFNLGTPSGISNIRYCTKIWAKKDKEMASKLLPFMIMDKTYQTLKSTISENAKAWTGSKDGITVMVGPGPGNGAHPDVSSISFFSGMPLVTKSDLYVDKSGNVRLNTGRGKNHPRVTGIYSRQEESFLLNDKEIPLITPDYDVEKLTSKFKTTFTNDIRYAQLKLKEGVWYDWEKDKEGNIIGVKFDESGNPKMLADSDNLGVDPTNPNAVPGSLANAITSKKLYTNVVGGRVMDDKKVFEIVSRCFAPLEKYSQGDPVAHPPRSYRSDEFLSIIEKAEKEGPEAVKKVLQKFVIKEPDGSGGSGIHILVNDTPEKRLEVLKEYKKHADNWVVQEFVSVAALLIPITNKKGEASIRTTGWDLRVFSMMGPDQVVKAFPHSTLLRTAKPTILEDGIGGDARSNTSAGGGYGTLAVISGDGTKPSEALDLKKMMEGPAQDYIAASREKDLQRYLITLKRIEALIDNNYEVFDINMRVLAQKGRAVMDLMGPKFNKFLYIIRKYLETKSDTENAQKEKLKNFGEELKKFIAKISSYDQYPIANMKNLVNKYLKQGEFTYKQSFTGDQISSKNQLKKNVTIQKISEKDQKVMGDVESNGIKYQTKQVAIYTDSKDKFVQKVIFDLNKAGGKLYRTLDIPVVSSEEKNAPRIKAKSHAFFMVDENGVPQINIDLLGTGAFNLSSLAHEHGHFKHFIEVREQVINEHKEKKIEISLKDASLLAQKRILHPIKRIEDEARAVKIERFMDTQRHASIYNRGRVEKIWSTNNIHSIYRNLYPQIEGLRAMLFAKKNDQKDYIVSNEEMTKTMKSVIESALNIRKESYQYNSELINNKNAKTRKGKSKEAKREQQKNQQEYLNYITESNLFALIFDKDIGNFLSNQTNKDLINLYKNTLKNIDMEKFKVSKNDYINAEVDEDFSLMMDMSSDQQQQ
ncbi:MAG: hypothetical protein HQK49_13520 [Oligoflexia bacterium]|nr:hypothetical protein [Oligoflexia bacterium]